MDSGTELRTLTCRGQVFSLIGGIVAFFSLLDWVVSKKEADAYKNKLVSFWMYLDNNDLKSLISNSNSFFNSSFNFIYGRKTFSAQKIIFSSLTSVICIGIISFFYALTGQGVEFGHLGLIFLPVFLFLNLVIDYFSTAETAWMLRVSACSEPYMLPIYLILDVILTFIIYAIPFTFFFGWLDGDLSGLYFAIGAFTGNAPFAAPIFCWSTFTASFIFYLFMISTAVWYFFDISKSRFAALLERLIDSDNFFKSIGLFISSILALIKSAVDVFYS